MGSTSTITISEHEHVALPDGLNKSDLISYLDEVWINRLTFGVESLLIEETGDYSIKQPFLTFTHDGRIKANNYVGFTHWQDTRIEVTPKVFENRGPENLWPHLIYWLSYCRKINFPFSTLNTAFEKTENFPEALIYTFAVLTRSVLRSTPFSRYEEVTEVSQEMKGQLDFKSYINEQFCKGNPHRLVVKHSPLLFNNLLNQIIKSVALRLQGICMFEDTFHILQDILFQMEDVEDVHVTAADCDRVYLNRLFTEYSQVLDMSRFFINEGYLSSDVGTYQSFSFMIPMEVVFEDYLAGFLERHRNKNYTTFYQSKGWLTDQGIFQLKYDIILQEKNTKRNIIVDAKYKLRTTDDKGKKGISQNDLYQMIAYALRKNCNTVLLLYPEYSQSRPGVDRLSISSEMMTDGPIKIYAANVPFVHNDLSLADERVKKALGTILKEVGIGDFISSQPL